MSLDQNMPPPGAPIVDANGCLTQLGIALVRTLWSRTGFAPGVSSDDLALLTILAQGQSERADPVARHTADAAYLEALFRPTPKPDLTQALLFALANTRSPPKPVQAGYVFPASEVIAAGDLVNVYVTGGVMTVRKADATDPSKFCNSFSLTGIANAATGPIQFSGFNDRAAVATGAAEAWLSDVTPGAFTTTAPTTTGHLLQTVGAPILGLGLAFAPGTYTIL